MRTGSPTWKPSVDGELVPIEQVIVCTEIDVALNAVIGPFAFVPFAFVVVPLVVVPVVPWVVVTSLSFEPEACLAGTSAIATSTWFAQAIFTRSPFANCVGAGE